MAIRETCMFDPRYPRHLTRGLRITVHGRGVIGATSNYAVFEILPGDGRLRSSRRGWCPTPSSARSGMPVQRAAAISCADFRSRKWHA